MATSREQNEELKMEEIRFAHEERKRRHEAPVHVRREDYLAMLPEASSKVTIVDPRLGFTNHTHRFWINKLPPGGEEGQQWKSLGHRHTVEAVIYWLTGHGYSIIDGVRYDWKPGDFICVPMFSWHRHVNDSDEQALYLASTTGPLSMGIGQAVYEDERYPQFFVFAKEGAEHLKPWMAEAGAEQAADAEAPHTNLASQLYAQSAAFALEEEERRRQSRVLVRADEVVFEPTPMGDLAYIIDPRIGFNTKAMATLMGRVPAGRRSGAHRHLYDEIDYVLEGDGTVVVDDVSYEVHQGDVLAIPVFAWHQYFNTGDAPLKLLCFNTRPAMENLGLMLLQQGELANY